MLQAFASAEMPYSSQAAVQSQEFEAGGKQNALLGYSRKVLAQTAVTGTGELQVSKDLYFFIQGFQGKAQGHVSRRHGLMEWWFLRFLEQLKIPESCFSTSKFTVVAGTMGSQVMFFTRTVWRWSLGGSWEGIGKARLSPEGLGNGTVSTARPPSAGPTDAVISDVGFLNHSQPNPSVSAPTHGPTGRDSPFKPGGNLKREIWLDTREDKMRISHSSRMILMGKSTK